MKKTPRQTPPGDSPPPLAQILFEKIESVKRSQPGISRKIDALEDEIREEMAKMKTAIDSLETEEEQKLLTVLLINDIHRSVEGILTAGLGAE